MYSRKKSLSITALSLVFNFLVTFWVTRWFGAKNPTFIAFGVTLSMFVHELGHALVLEVNGVKTNMVFLLILAGVSPAEASKRREKALKSSIKSFVYLAGTMGNLALICVCFVGMYFGLLDKTMTLKMINLNAGLIFWNLLPIGIFDGGRFMLIFFESIKEIDERGYVWALTLLSVTSVLAIGIISGKVVIFPCFLLLRGIDKKSKLDDPKAYYNTRKRLSDKERFVWASIWLSLLIFGCAVSLNTPTFK